MYNTVYLCTYTQICGIHHLSKVRKSLNKRPLTYEKCILACSGITIKKIFLSLSERTCLIKKYPVPIKTIVVNNNAPFNL